MTSLTIKISDELNEELRKFCQDRQLSPQEAIGEILRRQLAVQKFRELAGETEKCARAAGFKSEDDILGAGS